MVKKIIYILISLLFQSCLEIDCEANAKWAREKECNIIFESFPKFSTYKFDAKGHDIYTGQACICEDKGRWWTQYEKFIDKGDTIIKRKGELIFSIHKKDTVLIFNWKCNGKVYK